MVRLRGGPPGRQMEQACPQNILCRKVATCTTVLQSGSEVGPDYPVQSKRSEELVYPWLRARTTLKRQKIHSTDGAILTQWYVPRLPIYYRNLE